MKDKIDISLIIPVFNEEENIIPLSEKVNSALKKFKFEVLWIDDGSTDKTLERIKQVKKNNPRHRYISFAKNYGQSIALITGFKHAKGDIIAIIDGDMQNDPEDIKRMLPLLKEADIVCGIRKNRKDNIIRRISSKIANTVRNWITNENIKDTGCSLKLIKKEYAQKIPSFNGMHRFLPTLIRLFGGKVAEIEVSHFPRERGKSKYGIRNRLITSFLDCLAIRWMQKRYISPEVKESPSDE